MLEGIVVTGEGIVCAIGLDKRSVQSSLRSCRSGIGAMHHLCSCHRDLPVGEVPLSDAALRELLGLDSSRRVSRTALLGMLAVDQALGDGSLDRRVVSASGLRVVLISGTTVAGMDVTERHFGAMQRSCAAFLEGSAVGGSGCVSDAECGEAHSALQSLETHSAGSCTRVIAEHFGLFSEYTTVSTACSSSANALMVGARLLADGEADVVVCGGAEALSVFHLNGFRSLMILDSEPCRPFDATRAGLNLGEGAAFVVMETAEGARRRGVSPHAYLTGYGNACDAYHQTASSAGGDGAVAAMTEALDMAGLATADIQYVNAHGTGTLDNDQSESVALRRVFGADMPLVSSTKGFTGHTTSASGAIEAVISILALTGGFVPANYGWSQPMADGVVPTMGVDSCELHHMLCNSFGFGGNDTALVFSAEPPGEHCPMHNAVQPAGNVRVLSEVEITSEEQLAELSDYVSPLEARRMGKLMRSSLLASLKALRLAGVSQPDAIITATARGCWENSEQLLLQLVNEGETLMKPTLFMQSTHNTIGSNIAIRLKCHGYNMTYSQDEQSMEWAMRDARRLLESGRCRTVLVGCHDETTELFRLMMRLLGHEDLPAISSKAIVMSCGR